MPILKGGPEAIAKRMAMFDHSVSEAGVVALLSARHGAARYKFQRTYTNPSRVDDPSLDSAWRAPEAATASGAVKKAANRGARHSLHDDLSTLGAMKDRDQQ
ncbi:hypothetical protein BaRGS_00002197 [Batillaria attramentaria]|uniref:Uncharacterized protein n=1 Tax=Batillaria attramentaria TaxID=370345 RepID=A0ABD0M5D9_9CAEN